MTQSNQAQSHLLQNSLCFILRSMECLDQSEHITKYLENFEKKDLETELKYSLLHLHSGVSLLLKEILRREHWTLIIKPKDKISTNYNKFQSGDFNSINMDNSIKLLKNTLDIKILDSEFDQLNKLRLIRNKLEHFHLANLKIKPVKSILGANLVIILKMIGSYFSNEEVDNSCQKQIDLIKDKSIVIEQYRRSKIKEIKKTHKDFSKMLTCYQCFGDYLKAYPKKKYLACLFCEEKITINDKEKLKECITDHAEGPIICGECGYQSVVKYTESVILNSKGYLCLSCFHEDLYVLTCNGCSEEFTADSKEEGDLLMFCPICRDIQKSLDI